MRKPKLRGMYQVGTCLESLVFKLFVGELSITKTHLSEIHPRNITQTNARRRAGAASTTKFSATMLCNTGTLWRL